MIVPVVVIGLPDTVKVVLATVTPVTVPPVIVVETVTLPFPPLSEIPVPALSLVTPVLVIFILPDVVTGLPVTCIPSPGTTPTLVTVPAAAALEALVTLPYASTVNVGYVYVPALTPDVAKSTVILPALVTGLLVTAMRDAETGVIPTLVTVPPPPLPPPFDEIVTAPFAWLIVMFVPATILVTPALLIVNVPVEGTSVRLIPLPATNVVY